MLPCEEQACMFQNSLICPYFPNAKHRRAQMAVYIGRLIIKPAIAQRKAGLIDLMEEQQITQCSCSFDKESIGSPLLPISTVVLYSLGKL